MPNYHKGGNLMKPPTYEIRKDGRTYVRSAAPACGYTAAQLKNLRAAGYRLYADGKLQK
jgi:hypothetical protein